MVFFSLIIINLLSSTSSFFFFTQPGKSLYTSMRELVENSLDAAESINELPDIEISM